MQQEFGQQQAIYGPMAKQLGSIFALGPNQEGFSPEEKQAYQTQIIEGTGANYAAAARATGENIAAQGGTGMPAGSQEQLRQDVALSAAREKSGEELGVTQADYQTGRQQWQQAGGDLMAIAAGENPLGYEQASTGAGTAAANTANQIAQQQNSWVNAALGMAGDVISQNPHNVFG